MFFEEEAEKVINWLLHTFWVDISPIKFDNKLIPIFCYGEEIIKHFIFHIIEGTCKIVDCRESQIHPNINSINVNLFSSLRVGEDICKNAQNITNNKKDGLFVLKMDVFL